MEWILHKNIAKQSSKDALYQLKYSEIKVKFRLTNAIVLGLLEEWTVIQLIKEFLGCFMVPEGSITCSWKPAIGSHTEITESRSYLHILHL
jgi:hypothetical protein